MSKDIGSDIYALRNGGTHQENISDLFPNIVELNRSRMDNDSILRTAMVTHMIAAKVHLGLHSEQAWCLVLCLGM